MRVGDGGHDRGPRGEQIVDALVLGEDAEEDDDPLADEPQPLAEVVGRPGRAGGTRGRCRPASSTTRSGGTRQTSTSSRAKFAEEGRSRAGQWRTHRSRRRSDGRERPAAPAGARARSSRRPRCPGDRPPRVVRRAGRRPRRSRRPRGDVRAGCPAGSAARPGASSRGAARPGTADGARTRRAASAPTARAAPGPSGPPDGHVRRVGGHERLDAEAAEGPDLLEDPDVAPAVPEERCRGDHQHAHRRLIVAEGRRALRRLARVSRRGAPWRGGRRSSASGHGRSGGSPSAAARAFARTECGRAPGRALDTRRSSSALRLGATAAEREDAAGELEPGAGAGVGEVVDRRPAGFAATSRGDRLGQIGRVGRRQDLVVDDGDVPPSPRERAASSRRSCRPCPRIRRRRRAPRTGPRRGRGPAARTRRSPCQLRRAVDAQRRGRGVLVAYGAGRAPAEDVVGAEVEEPRPAARAGPGQLGRPPPR